MMDVLAQAASKARHDWPRRRLDLSVLLNSVPVFLERVGTHGTDGRPESVLRRSKVVITLWTKLSTEQRASGSVGEEGGRLGTNGQGSLVATHNTGSMILSRSHSATGYPRMKRSQTSGTSGMMTLDPGSPWTSASRATS